MIEANLTGTEFRNKVNLLIPAGFSGIYYGITPPTGFLECNGAELLISAYGDLATAIYIGDGDNADTDRVHGYKTDGSGSRTTSGTHIKIPDSRGEIIRGWDNGRGIDSGRKLGSFQLDALQHLTGEINIETHPSTPNSGVFNTVSTSGFDSSTTASATSNHSTIDFDASRVARTATETRPRNIAEMYIIKY